MAWEIPILAFVGVFARAKHAAELPMWSVIAVQIGSFLSQCLVGPLLTISFSLFYYDERVRKEAFDLQHMMATLDRGPASAVPASV